MTASSLVLGAVAGREGKGLTGRGDVQLDGAVAALRRAAVALQPPELVVCEERAEDGRNAISGLCTCKDAWTHSPCSGSTVLGVTWFTASKLGPIMTTGTSPRE